MILENNIDEIQTHLNRGLINTLSGGKSLISIYNVEDYKKFEDDCWRHYEIFIRSYSGKLQLLRYNFEKFDEILQHQTDSKNISSSEINKKEFVKKTINNAIYSSLILDSHSLYIQILEQFFGLIFSLNKNKKSNLFWVPFIFSDYGQSKKGEKICFDPQSIYKEASVFLNNLEVTKDKFNFFKKTFDLEYVFFANLPFSFIENKKDKKLVFSKIFSKIYNFLIRFSNRDAYNAWKHRSRAFTGSLPQMRMNFKLEDGGTVSTPLYNECIFWYESEGDSILKMYTQTSVIENINMTENVLAAIFELIKCHGVSYDNSFITSYEKDPYKTYWLE